MKADIPGRLAALAIAVVAVAILGQYTFRGAPDVPIWDAWSWIAQVATYANGGRAPVVPTSMLAQNEHLYLVPTLAFHATASAVGYSLRPYAFVSVALFAGLGALLARVALSAGAGLTGALLAFLVAVSMRNYENLLAGYHFGIVLSVVSGTAALWIADDRRTASGLAVALALALVSLLSSAVGGLALALVVAVHQFDANKPRRLLIAASLLATLAVAGGAALYALNVGFRGYVRRVFEAWDVQSAAVAIVDWAKVMGGGVIGGKTAAVVGLVVIGWLVSCIVDEIRAQKRLTAPCAIALFSLASTFAVAWGRGPVYEPASRWAVYALPGAAMAVAWLCARVAPRFGARGRLGILAVLLWVWLTASNYLDATGYRNDIQRWAFELRTYLAYFNAKDPLTNEQLGRFNPTPPERMRRLVSLYDDLRPQAYRHGGGIELTKQLPSRTARAAVASVDGDVLEVTGPGYVHNRHICTHATGCLVRLITNVETQGAATVGIIVRTPDGAERANASSRLVADGSPHLQSVAVEVASGEQVDPYVFCYTANDRAVIHSFGLVVSRRDSASRQ